MVVPTWVALRLGLLLCLTSTAVAQSTTDDSPKLPEAFADLEALVHEAHYDEAIALAVELETDWSQSAGPESYAIARLQDELTIALREMGRSSEDETVERIRKAIRIKERLFGPEHREVADSLHLYGTILDARAEFPAAIEAYQRALSIRRVALGDRDPVVASTINSLAISYANSGRMKDALPLFQESVAIWDQAPDVDVILRARGHSNLGTMYQLLGDFTAARSEQQRALDIMEDAGVASTHPVQRTALYGLAWARDSAGELHEARSLYQRLYELEEEALGFEHPRVAIMLNGLGKIDERLGRFESAKRHYERALAASSASQGPDHPTTAHYMTSVATIDYFLGNYESARDRLARAIEIRRAALEEQSPDTAFSNLVLAMVEVELGDFEAAEVRLDNCTETFTSQLGEDHPWMARTYVERARIAAHRGDDAAAIRLADRAVGIFQRGAGDPLDLGSALQWRARYKLAAGEVEGALEDALAAEKAVRSQTRLVLQTLSEGVAQRFLGVNRDGLHVAISSLLAGTPTKEQILRTWDAVVRSRGMLLDELVARRRIVAQAQDEELTNLTQDVFEARSRLADLYVRGSTDLSAEEFDARLATAREDKERAETALAGRSVEFRRQAGEQLLGIEDVMAALPTGTALLAFVRFDRHFGSSPPTKHYVAFASGGGIVDFADVGSAEDIDGWIRRWRETLSGGRQDGGPISDQASAVCRRMGTELRARIWNPLSDVLNEAQRVIIVPDGMLHLFPFSALPDGDDGFLIESGPLLRVVSHERLLASPPIESDESSELLAMGDPAYDRRSSRTVASNAPSAERVELEGVLRGHSPKCGHFREMTFTPLPGTRSECEAVSELWPRARDPLMGADASEAAFKQFAGSVGTLHLATHGWFLQEECGSGQEDSFTGDPLLLSGLALAGANHRSEASPSEQDGVLTAEEIALLDLRSVRLAVLSACETGSGAYLAGEGIYGLRRAFETAGARTVVMSLWAVDDRATQRWMTLMYGSILREKSSVAEAVRRASVTVLADRRARGASTHPFWWAGFVVAGGQ